MSSTNEISTRRIISRSRQQQPIDQVDHQSNAKPASASASASANGLKPPPSVVKQDAAAAPGSDSLANSQATSASSTQQQQQQQQHALAMNYINKEPFNEDLYADGDSDSADADATDKQLASSSGKLQMLVIEKFKAIIGDIKRLQQQQNPEANKALIRDKYKSGLVLATTLKKLNRLGHIRVNRARIRTHEEKNKIDEYHLELQNLLYEISYLKKEINKCLEFKSLHDEIELASVAEMYERAPPDIANRALIDGDEHKLKLAQLDWELADRQNMTVRINELQNLIDLHDKQLKLKQAKLDALQPKLEHILDACRPALDYFNTQLADECSYSEHVQYLPKPLYQLYAIMSAYKDTCGQ